MGVGTLPSDITPHASIILSAPELSAPNEYIGYFGTGTFIQTKTYYWDPGTNTVSGNLFLGYNSGSNGTYELDGSNQLSSSFEYVGYNGTGTLSQGGGTNTIANGLCLAFYSGSNGTYNFNGGTLVLSSLAAGSGTAAFNFGGGTLGPMPTSPPPCP